MSDWLIALLVVLSGGCIFLVAAFFAQRWAHRRPAPVEQTATATHAARDQRRRAPFVGHWTRRVEPHLPRAFDERVTRHIVMAGGLDGLSPAEVLLYVLVSGSAGLGLAWWFVVVSGWPSWLGLLGLGLGLAYPFMWLRDRVKARHEAILRELPYHVDLLTLCVEAGLDFGAGVARMVERGRPGPLRDDFAGYLAEVRMGKTRAEALESMSARVGLPALSSVTAALIQADRLGGGLGKTLRLQSEQLREERFQRAERLANEAPVKILLPLVLFVFPTIWIILAAPLLYDWIFR